MAPKLDISSHRTDGEVDLVLRGELEISTAPRLREALRELISEGADVVRMDISEVEFIDSTGLRALLAAQQQASVAGWRLALTRAPPHVQQMFALTHTEGLLPFED